MDRGDKPYQLELRNTKWKVWNDGIKNIWGYSTEVIIDKDPQRYVKRPTHPGGSSHSSLFTSTHMGLCILSEVVPAQTKCQVRLQEGLGKIKVPFKFY